MQETEPKNQNPNAMATASDNTAVEPKPATKSHKGVIIAVVIILVVCALAVGGFFGYRYYKHRQDVAKQQKIEQAKPVLNTPQYPNNAPSLTPVKAQ